MFTIDPLQPLALPQSMAAVVKQCSFFDYACVAVPSQWKASLVVTPIQKLAQNLKLVFIPKVALA